MVHLALYQPEIPQNTGTLMRTVACLGSFLHLIGPLGFLLANKHLRRSHMDYKTSNQWQLHNSWEAFSATQKKRRLIALSSEGKGPFQHFSFQTTDTLLLGQESKGLPEEIMAQCGDTLYIPMNTAYRSLNVAIAGAIALGEALRQTEGFPKENQTL